MLGHFERVSDFYWWYKKQDSPWDADLTGSVASTVDVKIPQKMSPVKQIRKFSKFDHPLR
jgi:hypothetical protein